MSYAIEDSSLVLNMSNGMIFVFNEPLDIPNVQEAFGALNTMMLDAQASPNMVKISDPVTVQGEVKVNGKLDVEIVNDFDHPIPVEVTDVDTIVKVQQIPSP